MGFSLKNFLEEQTAQINPFDKSKTAVTIRRNRDAQVAQTKKQEEAFKTPQWQDIQRKANTRNTQKFQSGQIDRPAYEKQRDIVLGNGAPIQQVELGGFDKFNKQMADRASNNFLSRNVITGAAQLNPTKLVGNVVGYAGRAGQALGWDDGKYLAQSGDQMAGYTNVDPQGDFASRGLADELVRGGIELAGDIVNPISRIAAPIKYGTQSANDLSREMEATGQYSPQQSFLAGTGLGVVSGALERTGIDKITGKAVGRGIRGVTTRLVSSGLTEGVTEGAQTLAENAARRMTVNPEQNVFDNVGKSALVGGILGAGARGGVELGTNPEVQQKANEVKNEANDRFNHGRILDLQAKNNERLGRIQESKKNAVLTNNKPEIIRLEKIEQELLRTQKVLDRREKWTRNRLGLSLELTNDSELSKANNAQSPQSDQSPYLNNKKASPSDTNPLESLKQEARTVYRGGEPLDINKIDSSGIPLTTSEKVADYYKGGKRNGVKESYTLSPDAKIKTVKNAKTEGDRFKALAQAEKEGYDGVDFGGAESEIRLTNNSKLQAIKKQTGVHDSLADNLPNQSDRKQADNVFGLTQQSPVSDKIITQKATQSQPPKSPLKTDAKNNKVYHGSSVGGGETGDRYGKGLYVTTDKNRASGYANGGAVDEYSLDGSKLANLDDKIDNKIVDTLKKEINDSIKSGDDTYKDVMRLSVGEKTFSGSDIESARRFRDERATIATKLGLDAPVVRKNSNGEFTVTYVDDTLESLKNIDGNRLFRSLPSPTAQSLFSSAGYDGVSYRGMDGDIESVIYSGNLKKSPAKSQSPKSPLTVEKIDSEIQEVVTATEQMLKDGDLDNARMLAESLPEAQKQKLIQRIDESQEQIENQILAEVQGDIDVSLKSEMGDGNADAAMRVVADKLAKHLNAPKSLYKFTGAKRTYRTSQGDLLVGGNAKSALDNIIFGTDIDGFSKNISILSEKFGGTFKEINNYMSATAPDGADYDIFKENLYGQLKKRPSYTRGNSTASQNSPIARSNTKAKSQRNQTTSPTSQQQLKPTLQDALEGRSTKVTKKIEKQSSPQLSQKMTSEEVVSDPQPQPTQSKRVSPKEVSLPDNTTKKSRFANKTVQQSKEVSQSVQKQVKSDEPQFYTITNEEQLAKSSEYLKKQGVKKATTDINERLASKKVDDQTVSDAIAVAKALDAKSDNASQLEASRIYEQLSVKLSKAGQTIQAASLLNNRTPEGLQYGALRAMKKAGVEPTNAQRNEVKRLIGEVKKAKAGSYEDGLARYRVQEYVAKQIPSSKSGKAVQLWKAGLLTSPRTTAGNLAANTFEGVFRKGYVDPVANAFDAVFSLFTGQRSRSNTLKGMASGAKEGAIKGVSYFKTGYDPRNPAQKFDVKNIHYSDSPLGKAAETYTQGVFRLMGSQDQPFYYAALRNSLYDQALTEAKNQGLKGNAKKDFVKKFVTEPQTKAMNLADKEARYAVFQDETSLGKAASRLKSTEGAMGTVAEFVIPFSGVPSSIATRMITRTPIGTATEVVRQMRSGKFDQRAMTKSIAEGSAVVPLVAVGATLMANGLMTLDFPDDAKERELWEADGRQPYSIKVGDTWLSTNYFQPAGNLLAAGATYQDQINKGENPNKALYTALGASGQALTEQSFLQGVSGTLNAVQQPDRYAQRFVEQTAGSVVPNIVRTAARASDPYARNVSSPIEAMQAGIPGARQKLQQKYDLFGRPVERRSDPLSETINPFRPSDAKNTNDPVLKETRRLNDAGEGIIPSQATKQSFGKELSETELIQANQQIGSSVRKQWEKIMKDPRYKNISDADKNKVLDRANSAVYDYNKSLYVDGTELNTRAKMYRDGKDIDWFDGLELSKESAKTVAQNSSVEKLFKQAGLPPVPLNADLEYDFAQLQYSLEGKNDIDREKATSSFFKSAYKSQLDDVSQSFYTLGDDDMRSELQKGTISKAQMDKIIELDDMLTANGLQSYPQVGKTLRRELGYSVASSGSSKSSSRKSSSSGKKASTFDLSKLFGFGSPATSTNKSLRALLESLV